MLQLVKIIINILKIKIGYLMLARGMQKAALGAALLLITSAKCCGDGQALAMIFHFMYKPLQGGRLPRKGIYGLCRVFHRLCGLGRNSGYLLN